MLQGAGEAADDDKIPVGLGAPAVPDGEYPAGFAFFQPSQSQLFPGMPDIPEPFAQDLVVAPQQQALYGLGDQQYGDWKRARAACRKSMSSIDSLRNIAAADKKLLNWRNPVDGQTLLHEMVSAGADESVIQQAVELGCDPVLPNLQGLTPAQLAARKSMAAASLTNAFPPQVSRLATAGRALPLRQKREPRRSGLLDDEPAVQMPQLELQQRSSASLPPPPTPQSKNFSALARRAPMPFSAPMSSSFSVPQPQMSAPMPSAPSSQRRKGLSLAKNESASMPKAKINLDFDLCEEGGLNEMQLQAAVQKAYGGSARVQIDSVSDRVSAGPRIQNAKCRVLFDDAEEAQGWQTRSACSRVVQESIAQNMQIRADAVEYAAPSQMAEVDAVTLKLDSDSSHILCGACLLYDFHGNCEKVIHYSDRLYNGGVVQHSGDTKVDGKSVHTISFVQSQIPTHITQMYFTLCSCGPQDLSGFSNPSIMLYDHSEPDANLLEYSIGQAGKSPSCVMAQLSRRPKWSSDERIIIACALRRVAMPFLGVDLCLAMAGETSWDVKGLGTEEWHLESKICGNYESCKCLISDKWHQASHL